MPFYLHCFWVLVFWGLKKKITVNECHEELDRFVANLLKELIVVKRVPVILDSFASGHWALLRLF